MRSDIDRNEMQKGELAIVSLIIVLLFAAIGIGALIATDTARRNREFRDQCDELDGKTITTRDAKLLCVKPNSIIQVDA